MRDCYNVQKLMLGIEFLMLPLSAVKYFARGKPANKENAEE